MQLKKFLEFNKSDLEPVKSFKIQDKLNPKIWDNMKLNPEIREDLLKIGKDFFNSTGLECELKDVILTGSLANFNWSKYSDYDIHIIIDFKEVNKDIDLVKELVDGKKSIWNLEHDIKIKGYEIEVYIQDEKEPHISSGVFSLLNNKWIIKPKKEDFEPNEKEIEKKGVSLMKQIDKIEKDYKKSDYEKTKNRIKKVWEKIKKLRKDSLKKEGEFGIGNLVFKLLRRNNYIGKIIKIKRDAYVNQFKSFKENSEDKILDFLYKLDKISLELREGSDESTASYLSYEFLDDKIEIEYGYSTYSDGSYEKLELDISNLNNIKVKVNGHVTSPYGDSDWDDIVVFNSLDEILNYLDKRI